MTRSVLSVRATKKAHSESKRHDEECVESAIAQSRDDEERVKSKIIPTIKFIVSPALTSRMQHELTSLIQS